MPSAQKPTAPSTIDRAGRTAWLAMSIAEFRLRPTIVVGLKPLPGGNSLKHDREDIDEHDRQQVVRDGGQQQEGRREDTRRRGARGQATRAPRIVPTPNAMIVATSSSPTDQGIADAIFR